MHSGGALLLLILNQPLRLATQHNCLLRGVLLLRRRRGLLLLLLLLGVAMRVLRRSPLRRRVPIPEGGG